MERLNAVRVDPGAGAVVMGTGIVSIALALDHQPSLSRIWLVAAAAAWLALAALVVVELWRVPTVLRAAARSPSALSLVAATAVLGNRFAMLGEHAVSIVLLVLAAALWLALGRVLARRRALPRTGSAFMITVATESLASLAALDARASHAPWLTVIALALCVIGLAAYPVALMRFDARQLLVGLGDQWIAGGALAISALALSDIAAAASSAGTWHALAPTIGSLAAIVWVAGMLWLPVLVAAELRAPRPAYHLRRWSTLFPVGMYAASGLAVARAPGLHSAASFAHVWTWVGVALSIALAAGLASRVHAVGAGVRAP